MPKLRLSGRKAALAGVSIAAATAAVVAVAAPASAAPNQLTTCNDTVRVRSQPSQSAPVTGSCRSGEQVTVDRTQNGYAHLVNKQGWASMDYLNMRRDGDSSSSYRDDSNNDDYDNNDRYSNSRYNDYNNDYYNDDDYGYRRHNNDGLLGGLGGDN
ncbi:MAG TPA: SH3 domain-containing protein [Pseudonocardia sp.]